MKTSQLKGMIYVTNPGRMVAACRWIEDKLFAAIVYRLDRAANDA